MVAGEAFPLANTALKWREELQQLQSEPQRRQAACPQPASSSLVCRSASTNSSKSAIEAKSNSVIFPSINLTCTVLRVSASQNPGAPAERGHGHTEAEMVAQGQPL